MVSIHETNIHPYTSNFNMKSFYIKQEGNIKLYLSDKPCQQDKEGNWHCSKRRTASVCLSDTEVQYI